MPTYQIDNTTTDQSHGAHEGTGPDQAMDAMARAEGYKDRRDMCDSGERSRHLYRVTRLPVAAGSFATPSQYSLTVSTPSAILPS